MGKFERRSNLELLRVICMIMIITLHTLGHGGAFNSLAINSKKFVLAHLIQSLCIVAVNCYILISGFFGINSKFKFKKVFSLYIQVLFYSIVISCLFWITRIQTLDTKSIQMAIFPITMESWWFISKFIVLYLLTPYINKLLKSLSLKEFNKFLIILLFIFIIWPLLPNASPMDVQKGYSLYNFIFFYIMGAYISIFFKNKKLNRYMLFIIYFSSSLLLCILNVVLSRVRGEKWMVYDYNFILVFISSIALFLFFNNINFQSRIINMLSVLTLGVYLIHDHIYVRNFIYKALKYESSFNSNKILLYTIVVIFVIFISSSIIEYIRQYLFKSITKYKNILGTKYNFRNLIN